MAAYSKRVCWDACAWIALIQKEKIRDEKTGKIIEDREALCRSVMDSAEQGDTEIVISGLCLVEVCRHPDIKNKSDAKIADYFENEYILIVSVDKFVGTQARHLMLSQHPRLKPLDAVHVATALISNADELHTFDRDLLGLNGKLTKLDGTMLKICKPAQGGAALPLLDRFAQPEEKNDAFEAEPDDAIAAIRGNGEAVGVRPARGGVQSAPEDDRSAQAAATTEAAPVAQVNEAVKPAQSAPPMAPLVSEPSGSASPNPVSPTPDSGSSSGKDPGLNANTASQ